MSCRILKNVLGSLNELFLKSRLPFINLIQDNLLHYTAPTDLRKKAVKKFEWRVLRNEIDVTNVW